MGWRGAAQKPGSAWFRSPIRFKPLLNFQSRFHQHGDDQYAEGQNTESNDYYDGWMKLDWWSILMIPVYKSVVDAQSWEPKRRLFDPEYRIGCDSLPRDIAITRHCHPLTVPQNAAGSYTLQSNRSASRECAFECVNGFSLTINLSVAFIDWTSRAFVSLSVSIVDSSRESNFGRPSFGEIKLNNPGESRKPDNRNNLSRSPQRILPRKKFHNGASQAFWPHSQTTHLPQSMLTRFSYLLPLNSVRLRSRHHQGWIPSYRL